MASLVPEQPTHSLDKADVAGSPETPVPLGRDERDIINRIKKAGDPDITAQDIANGMRDESAKNKEITPQTVVGTFAEQIATIRRTNNQLRSFAASSPELVNQIQASERSALNGTYDTFALAAVELGLDPERTIAEATQTLPVDLPQIEAALVKKWDQIAETLDNNSRMSKEDPRRLSRDAWNSLYNKILPWWNYFRNKGFSHYSQRKQPAQMPAASLQSAAVAKEVIPEVRQSDFVSFSLDEIKRLFPDIHPPISVSEAITRYQQKEIPDSAVPKIFSAGIDIYKNAGIEEGIEQGVIRFLGIGKEQIALLLEDGSVLKIVKPSTRFSEDWGKREFDAPIMKKGEVETDERRVRWYTQPLVELMNNNPTDQSATDQFATQLYNQGQEFSDYRPYQLGRDAKGKVWLIDYVAVHPLRYEEGLKASRITFEEFRQIEKDHLTGGFSERDRDSANRTLATIGEQKFRAYYGDHKYNFLRSLNGETVNPSELVDTRKRKDIIGEEIRRNSEYQDEVQFFDDNRLDSLIPTINDERRNPTSGVKEGSETTILAAWIDFNRVSPRILDILQKAINPADFALLQEMLRVKARTLAGVPQDSRMIQSWRSYFASQH